MRRKSCIDAPSFLATAAIVLMALCCLCAPVPSASSSFSSASLALGEEGLGVACASVPRAADAGIPSSLTTPASGINFARLPSRGHFRAAAASLLRIEYIPVVCFALRAPRIAAAQAGTDTPEFTPYLFIKTTRKRE